MGSSMLEKLWRKIYLIGKKDYRRADIGRQGLLFAAEFWTDTCYGVRWAKVSLVTRILARKHLFSRYAITKERLEIINKAWGAWDRVEWCNREIDDYLKERAQFEEDEKRVEELCRKEPPLE